jgi:arylsulfatase A-like enzyme
MYEESMHTPLVMMLPKGYDKRGDIDAMVQNIDYAPTFLELAGVEVPSDIQGESFLPLLKGEKMEPERDYLYYHYYEYPAEHMVKRHYGVRDHRYKLMHFYNDIDVWELYDLEKDPTEMHNIYGKPGTEDITKRMMKKLKEAQEKYDDPIRLKYPIQ